MLLEVIRQMSAKGLYIKTGEVSIVDATVIEAKQSRPRKNANGENTQDSEAGYSVKVAQRQKTSTYGYKATSTMRTASRPSTIPLARTPSPWINC